MNAAFKIASDAQRVCHYCGKPYEKGHPCYEAGKVVKLTRTVKFPRICK